MMLNWFKSLFKRKSASAVIVSDGVQPVYRDSEILDSTVGLAMLEELRQEAADRPTFWTKLVGALSCGR